MKNLSEIKKWALDDLSKLVEHEILRAIKTGKNHCSFNIANHIVDDVQSILINNGYYYFSIAQDSRDSSRITIWLSETSDDKPILGSIGSIVANVLNKAVSNASNSKEDRENQKEEKSKTKNLDIHNDIYPCNESWTYGINLKNMSYFSYDPITKVLVLFMNDAVGNRIKVYDEKVIQLFYENYLNIPIPYEFNKDELCEE